MATKHPAESETHSRPRPYSGLARNTGIGLVLIASAPHLLTGAAGVGVATAVTVAAGVSLLLYGLQGGL